MNFDNKRPSRGQMAIMATALVLGISASHASAQQQLRVSTPAPPSDFLARSIDVFKQTLEKSAPGAFDVSSHPGGTLFKQGTEIPAMQRGNLEMNTLATFEVSQFVPELSVFNAGYLFDGYDHAKRIWDGPLGQDYYQKVREKMGVQILADCYLGTRELAINEVRNVKTPADLEGLKLRMPGAPDYLLLGKGLGADPTPMAMSEVYLGLKSGAIDGQDNPLTMTKAAKFDEVTAEIVLTNHFVQTVFYAIATPVFDALDAEAQSRVTEAARAACSWNDENRIKDEERLREEFAAAGIVITKPDLQSFRDNMAAVYQAEGKLDVWPKDIIDAIAAER